ncbi:hypothetical protein WR25_22796 [Diploscapter pachys]|uniref:Uncharacterized protein n=1 Tax=Diploscapter pachys TaxID=2018661 RepID=A0A2A2JJH4_9BILA|nr:hypothetical protein WR25_22796 [Diploscapter pachys]
MYVKLSLICLLAAIACASSQYYYGGPYNYYWPYVYYYMTPASGSSSSSGTGQGNNVQYSQPAQYQQQPGGGNQGYNQNQGYAQNQQFQVGPFWYRLATIYYHFSSQANSSSTTIKVVAIRAKGSTIRTRDKGRARIREWANRVKMGRAKTSTSKVRRVGDRKLDRIDKMGRIINMISSHPSKTRAKMVRNMINQVPGRVQAQHRLLVDATKIKAPQIPRGWEMGKMGRDKTKTLHSIKPYLLLRRARKVELGMISQNGEGQGYQYDQGMGQSSTQDYSGGQGGYQQDQNGGQQGQGQGQGQGQQGQGQGQGQGQNGQNNHNGGQGGSNQGQGQGGQGQGGHNNQQGGQGQGQGQGQNSGQYNQGQGQYQGQQGGSNQGYNGNQAGTNPQFDQSGSGTGNGQPVWYYFYYPSNLYGYYGK